MIWSKQKVLLENFLADSLKRRVQYHRTRYGPGDSFQMNRGWVTLDQKEIFSCSTIKSIIDMHQLTGVWYSRDEQSLEQLHQQGIFTLDDFKDAIQSILELEIEQSLASNNPITRAFAMFDRRLGKRRLKEMNIPEFEHALVQKFYRIRCEVEGLSRGSSKGQPASNSADGAVSGDQPADR
jgi:hypothetical protein